MSPNRTRLRIGLWALALILLGFTLGLKADELSTFKAATDTAHNSVSSLDSEMDPIVQNMLSDGFVKSLKELGDGDMYLGVQRLGGGSETSADFSTDSNNLFELLAGRAMAQAPPCNSTYQDRFKDTFYDYLDEVYQQEMARNNCVESVNISGKIKYTVYKKGSTYYVTYQIMDWVKEYSTWFKDTDGKCKRKITRTKPINGKLEVVQINSDGSYDFIDVLPGGVTLICAGSLNFGYQVKNPKFDKEACCKKLGAIPPVETEQ